MFFFVHIFAGICSYFVFIATSGFLKNISLTAELFVMLLEVSIIDIFIVFLVNKFLKKRSITNLKTVILAIFGIITAYITLHIICFIVSVIAVRGIR